MSDDNPLFDEGGKALDGVAMNSVDILQQKFAVKFRGYDVQDVDEFLEVVANEMEQLINDNTRMQQDISLYRKELELYKKKEESINATLVTVQEMAGSLKKNAVKEAETIVNSSRLESDNLLLETRQNCDALREEIRPLKEEARAEAQRIIDEAKKQKDEILRDLDQLKEDALVEAQKTIDDSKLEAGRTNDAAIKKMTQIEEEIDVLTQRKVKFQAALKSLIETHQRLLEDESNND
jgi:cell division initiation protein